MAGSEGNLLTQQLYFVSILNIVNLSYKKLHDDCFSAASPDTRQLRAASPF